MLQKIHFHNRGWQLQLRLSPHFPTERDDLSGYAAEIRQEIVAQQVAHEEAQISPIFDFHGDIWLRT